MDKRYLDGPREDLFKKRLFDDVYVNEVLDLLEGFDMQAEKENLLKVLSKIDGMYELIQVQEKSIQSLEEEIRKLNEPKAKKLLNEMLNEAKEELNILKNKLIDLKETVVERCKALVETFKASGQFAFCRAFEETSRVLKDAFKDIKARHIHSIEKTDKRIERIISIRNELNKAKGHFKNMGRLLIGKDAQDIKESKSTPMILIGALDHFEKGRHINEKLISIDDDCISRLDQLEKSFAEKRREKKRTLDDMILRASEKRKTSDKNNEQVLQQGR